MPYASDQVTHPHLEFVREERDTQRRKQSGRGGSRYRPGDRAAFAQELQNAANQLEEKQRQNVRRWAGINPRLVFRIPFAAKPDYKEIVNIFDRAGIRIVNYEANNAVVVFHDSENLEGFRQQIAKYQVGPRSRRDGELAASSMFDILEYIVPEGMRSWGRQDRIGTRLAALIGSDGTYINQDSLYTLELEVWHPGSRSAARDIRDELWNSFQASIVGDERWLDDYQGDAIILAKMRITGTRLDELLEQDIIASVDLPLIASFDVRQAAKTTERDFPSPPPPPPDGPRVCVIDSGIVSNHPLLRPYVGHEEAILTREDSPSDTNGHGTRVAALAVYGDVRACYERGYFASTITLFSARVLNNQNTFDDDRLIINQLRSAVEVFSRVPYKCRIFNVSIGGDKPALDSSRRHQNLYGEILDIIALEYDILFVVSAGNHQETLAAENEQVGEVFQTYPTQLFSPTARLCDFATTAIGLTVGALGEYNEIAVRSGVGADDIVRPIARRDEPAPMTRIGPGVQAAIKPDLVHYGGSTVFDRSRPHQLYADKGMSVMSFSHQPFQQLFDYDIGTSYAAPRVARLSALVEYQLRQQMNEEPQLNLVRAMIAASARIPRPAQELLSRTEEDYAHVRVCGYGLPDEELAIHSADGRVVMFAQSDIALDHLHFYRIPIPDCLLQARGERRITVALAFDPPVRGRRLDYLGIEMNFQLVRGKTFDEVYTAVSRLRSGEDMEASIEQSAKVKFEPVSQTREGGYSRKKSTLQCATHTMKSTPRKDYGNDYWLVVRAERGWVPDAITSQRYAVVVALEADTPELYAQVRQRIRQRQRVRV